jgi:hypothetical protein
VAAQTTTNTTCNTQGGGGTATTNCTSTTTNPSAQKQQDYDNGYKVGQSLGNALAAGIQAHSLSKKLKKYCEAHPNQTWTYRNGAGQEISSGTCPDADRSGDAANAFMAKHKDYIMGRENADAMIGYMDAHNLNPNNEKSYEMAYKDLKKENKLHLYAN